MTKPTIQKLPAPEGIARVETGPVQFGEDWPGVFFRGDNAAMIGGSICGIVDSCLARGRLESIDFFQFGLMLSPARDLVACDLSGGMPRMVDAIHAKMMRIATLVDAPPAGGVQ